MVRRASRTSTELARQDAMRGTRAAYDPLHPEVFALSLDTREQVVARIPLEVPIVVAALPMGDLSVPGFEQRIAIDRKQLGDFIGCITHDKERFARLLTKMAGLEFAAVVVEATLADVRARKYRSQVAPAFVVGAAARITTKYGVPVFFCGSGDSTMDFAIRLLRCWWRDRGLRLPIKAAEVSI